ncbi:MAG: hypothetical protein EKK45_16450 [Curvibacter sp.]|nr:MAG: hypothetical protein EKK45_16450 [Curvibacter sp.]
MVTPLKLQAILTTSLFAFEAAGFASCRSLLQSLAGTAGVFGPGVSFSATREGEFVAQYATRGLGLGERPYACVLSMPRS